MSKVDYLTEDTLLPDGQKFVCMSFLTDKQNKTSLSGIKIRGVFPTYESACEHAKNVQNVDPYFNVFVGELGKWLPFDPSPDSDSVKNSEYANEQLNGMMKAYLENQEKAKIFHEQRKNEMVRDNILDNLNIRKQNLQELKDKKAKTKSENELSGLNTNIDAVEDAIKKMEEKKSELEKQINGLADQIKSFGSSELQGPKILDV
jgi:hypothetical protein